MHNLQELLGELREEISGAQFADAKKRERLVALLAELEARIESETSDEEDEGPLAHLREMIGQLETEHPRATSILNRIMVSLGGAGI